VAGDGCNLRDGAARIRQSSNGSLAQIIER
jgi:hypothetical protein